MPQLMCKIHFLVLFSLLVSGCNRDAAVQFQPKSGDFALIGGASVIVSITDDIGTLLYDQAIIPLQDFTNAHTSHPISLPPGDYSLAEFIVLDTVGQPIFVTPLQGSQASHLVRTPLPISFTIAPEIIETVRPELIPVGDRTLADSGYVQFTIEDGQVVQILDFQVAAFLGNDSTETFAFTTADLTVTDETDTVLFAGPLIAGTNGISVRDGAASYTLTVSKAGFEDVIKVFSRDALFASAQSNPEGPIEFVLGVFNDGGLGVIQQVATGDAHSCALSDSGNLRCWGFGGSGRLGYGNTNTIGNNVIPASVGDIDVGGTVVQVDAGGHTCALLDTGNVRCWGHNGNGALGYGNTNNIGDDETPASAGDVDVGGTVVQIEVGVQHTCALLDTGNVRCWGPNGVGLLGYANSEFVGDDETPASVGDVDIGGTVVQIAAGLIHTCALLDTGTVRCWGLGSSGRLGYGNTNTIGDDETPASAGDVDVGGTVVQVTAGSEHTCALLDTGKVRCWGANNEGQLGYANSEFIGDDETPASAGDVDLGGTVTQITSGGGFHTCALLDTGTVRCWGFGSNGQLGYGNTNTIGDDETPASAGNIDVGGTVLQIAAGNAHTCALLDTGSIRCWGTGGFGPLGYGNSDNIGDDETPASAGDVPVF